MKLFGTSIVRSYGRLVAYFFSYVGTSGGERQKTAAQHSTGGAAAGDQFSPEHYLRLIRHRKWLVLGTLVAVSAATAAIVKRLPNIYTSETLILVDPQKVPETYVKPTVSGDVRNRLGTLSQQILSATRLQHIIEALNLYPEERKRQAREDVINKMRADISVSVVSDFGGGQDLQAFRIIYSGKESRLVAQVTNELASLFIEENLKAREQEATGTTEFLQDQLEETRKALEQQEAKLKDFKLKHIGEMPEQQSADLQILGQLQSQLQLEGDALSRAEQQKSYIQTMTAQAAPVVDLDEGRQQSGPKAPDAKAPIAPKSTVSADRARLAALLSRYTPDHPDVRRLKKQIEREEAHQASAAISVDTTPVRVAGPAPPGASAGNPAAPTVAPTVSTAPPRPVSVFNPVLEAQLTALDNEIAKHKQEQDRLSKLVSGYQAKLNAIPVREQEITELVRDYEMSKAHYSQLLDKQLSAETATQLEIRQKGEKFEILDPAQAAEKPSRPNRALLDAGGGIGGLALGLMLAIGTELLGVSITSPQDIVAASGLAVLEVIPVIQTTTDRRRRRRGIVMAVASVTVAALVSGAVLYYRYRIQI